MRIFRIEGPVKSGKSSFSIRMAVQHRAVRLCLDDWMVTLYQPDRPSTDRLNWYVERKARCLSQILSLAAQILDQGNNVVLELGIIRHIDRQAFYRSEIAHYYALSIYVVDAPQTTRLSRARARNRVRGETFHAVVSDDIFEQVDAMWEPPGAAEIKEPLNNYVRSAFQSEKPQIVYAFNATTLGLLAFGKPTKLRWLRCVASDSSRSAVLQGNAVCSQSKKRWLEERLARYGRVARRARCGFSGETHTGRGFAGPPPRLGSLV